MSEPQMVLTDPGHRTQYRSRRGRPRSVLIDRKWQVLLDGHVIGCIWYTMATRETRSGTQTYVSDRWESPGWLVREADDTHPDGTSRWRVRPSKAAALRELLDAPPTWAQSAPASAPEAT